MRDTVHPRPSVREYQRHRAGILGPDVDEVDVQPVNLGQELGEAIELGLEAPPVVAALPVADIAFFS
jgi:hypothetical protein